MPRTAFATLAALVARPALVGVLGLLSTLPLLPGPATAADITPPPEPRAPRDPLAGARQHIAARQWPQAVQALRQVNATTNADWHNLMGYAARHLSPPDLDAAQRHYDEALRLSPRHRGALEYAGELALMKDDLPTAEQRLATLQQACPSGCEELDDLKRAVQRYRDQRPAAAR
ncbi:lipopolysaccharide assembly protein LapB [Aquabacterium sp. J223]|uniref:tetratricopeptide repeat protein n=1 Tax=Aquabacterium sp. J223 TaxID=2898431 RepID=UPI0021AD7546|nr:tetratricopeptide repeat protein [Aquabacterium sp. J223]UUX96107.1 tetratricopeptide repeat protein [Aquabacterium sp. J223]